MVGNMDTSQFVDSHVHHTWNLPYCLLLGIGGSRNLSNVQIQWARIYKNNTTPMAYVLDCASRGTDLYLVEFIDAKAVKVHKLELKVVAN